MLALGLLLMAAVACAVPGLGGDQAVPAEQQTLQAIGTEAAQQTADAEVTEVEGTEPAAATEAPAEAEPTAAATIEHTTFPSDPGSISSFLTDRSTRSLASEGRAIADSFDQLLFERPFAAEGMEYKAYLDITRGELSASSPWFYVIIHLEEGAPEEAEPFYGVEIDIDKDGRGDWLIWGLVPPDSEWTTDGVQALTDSNNDVGDTTPVIANSPPQSGDGYDELVFDAGVGPDPDAAWIRRSPSAPDQIQIAFKQTLIGPPGEFLWGVWSDEGPQNPAFFDYNDHWSISEAGSPVGNSSNYPLKELAMVDNSCRWGYGFEPTGSEPGACFVPPTPTVTPTFTPTPPPEKPSYTVSGVVYRDDNDNGRRDSGEPGVSGATVTLHTFSCSGPVVGSISSGPSGGFSWSNRPAGDHCVTLDSWPSGYQPTTSTQQSFSLSGDISINFGIEVIG